MTSRRRKRSNSARRWRGISRPSPVRRTARSRSQERREGLFRMPWGEQQRFNTVFDALPLLHQLLALAVRALGILLFRCWHTYHAAGLMITPEIGRKHAQHALRIEPVRLGPSGSAVDENAGGFKNMANDTMCRQQTVQPEAVTSASKQQTTFIAASSPRAARACRVEIRANKAAVSPPSIRCRCGFSHPGTRAATSHVDALSSIARRIVGLTVSIVCIVAAPSL